jgi:hypothetical protein
VEALFDVDVPLAFFPCQYQVTPDGGEPFLLIEVFPQFWLFTSGFAGLGGLLLIVMFKLIAGITALGATLVGIKLFPL